MNSVGSTAFDCSCSSSWGRLRWFIINCQRMAIWECRAGQYCFSHLRGMSSQWHPNGLVCGVITFVWGQIGVGKWAGLESHQKRFSQMVLSAQLVFIVRIRNYPAFMKTAVSQGKSWRDIASQGADAHGTDAPHLAAAQDENPGKNRLPSRVHTYRIEATRSHRRPRNT